MGHKDVGYDFEIIYKKGKKNVVVDALSRKDEGMEALLCAQPDWKQTFKIQFKALEQ